MITTQDGVFTRTGAFNFLKDLIGIKRRGILINRTLFEKCFKGVDGYFWPRIPEAKIKEVFTKCEVSRKNQLYWLHKQNGEKEVAQRILSETIQSIDESLRAA